ncbi:VOC family protein [Scytonema sp. HK-05]|uniref:VOC family protein n=1 Tax=Scytonema sp. HK-05 TaxID=1137095 RepID=UPI0009370F79|nr:VOC family protein [Scytonema sp. HK-05]OKH54019.1 glyoxalase [Scytonema sp. HK-05]
MQITQCLHTAILVTDLERAEHFYGKVLGLPKIQRSLKYPGAWYQVGNYQIHLIAAVRVPTEDQNEKWGRNPHIALCVADLDAAKQQLLDHNCLIQPSASGRPALFTKDPDGNVIELIDTPQPEGMRILLSRDLI